MIGQIGNDLVVITWGNLARPVFRVFSVCLSSEIRMFLFSEYREDTLTQGSCDQLRGEGWQRAESDLPRFDDLLFSQYQGAEFWGSIPWTLSLLISTCYLSSNLGVPLAKAGIYGWHVGTNDSARHRLRKKPGWFFFFLIKQIFCLIV